MGQTADTVFHGRKIKQKRGRRTYDALISTAFKLLEKREFDEITIAEIAAKGGYSVGAFYARFRSKSEFFDAMIAHHMEQRSKQRDSLFASLPDDTWMASVFDDLVAYYWKRRRFWRAALIRSIRDPDFWEPLRQHGHELADRVIERISRQAGRRLTAAEEMDVRFALQVVLSTINNAIINRPGPILIGQPAFVANLARTFRLVSNYDEIVRASKRRERRKE
ncbi:MAG TPA: TetR/AcrR family transcriptional regulator [Gammaproteobacteria bacterium]|nr:TetR/AcrR family transcriptional regulator [Gammaproteobacteria bacterium]